MTKRPVTVLQIFLVLILPVRFLDKFGKNRAQTGGDRHCGAIEIFQVKFHTIPPMRLAPGLTGKGKPTSLSCITQIVIDYRSTLYNYF